MSTCPTEFAIDITFSSVIFSTERKTESTVAPALFSKNIFPLVPVAAFDTEVEFHFSNFLVKRNVLYIFLNVAKKAMDISSNELLKMVYITISREGDLEAMAQHQRAHGPVHRQLLEKVSPFLPIKDRHDRYMYTRSWIHRDKDGFWFRAPMYALSSDPSNVTTVSYSSLSHMYTFDTFRRNYSPRYTVPKTPASIKNNYEQVLKELLECVQQHYPCNRGIVNIPWMDRHGKYWSASTPHDRLLYARQLHVIPWKGRLVKYQTVTRPRGIITSGITLPPPVRDLTIIKN